MRTENANKLSRYFKELNYRKIFHRFFSLCVFLQKIDLLIK
jgi:hypothetical protein